MNEIFSMSAYQTDAEDFFTALRKRKTDLVLDVRRKNTSQLCGFTKEKDLAYFTAVIVHADYCHDLLFAPSEDLLDDYLHAGIGWETYRDRYRKEMEEKDALTHFREAYGRYHSICLVGTATNRRRSHSEVLEEMLKENSR